MPENTFDIVSKVDLQEVSNAIQQALKEIHTALRPEGLEVEHPAGRQGSDRAHLGRRLQAESGERVLQGKLVKRGVPLKALQLRRDRARSGLDGAPEGHHAAGHPDRKGARNRKG